MDSAAFPPVTRRAFVAGTAAAGAAILSPGLLRAAAKRTRRNMTSPEGRKDLKSYMDAVQAMLRLPPEDPRNWYRNGFIHLMDCPHGDWWFTSWHRGYLGYFEQTCRELSGNPDFALPYWDWTADPLVPPPMFDTVLDPVNSPAYIPDHAAFEKTMRGPVEAYWNTLDRARLRQQVMRGYINHDALWTDAMASFADRGNARFATAAAPRLNPDTQKAVAIDTIRNALRPTLFANAAGDTALAFNSPMACSHQVAPVGFSILEGQPHNRVHMSVGGQTAPYGLMSQNLSPLDPIFFLHHCNIDRLWDVWTRKQIALGLPTGPTSDQAPLYDPEPYLFFVGPDGAHVTDKTEAADYLDIGAFDYDYAPASGEDVVPAPRRAPAIGALAAMVAPGAAGIANLTVSPELAASIARPAEQAQQFATIAFTPPMDVAGTSFQVFIHAPGAAPNTDPEGPEFAGSFEFFGVRHKHAGTVSFTLAIGETLDRMVAAGLIEAGAPIAFSLVAASGAEGPAATVPANLISVQVGSF